MRTTSPHATERSHARARPSLRRLVFACGALVVGGCLLIGSLVWRSAQQISPSAVSSESIAWPATGAAALSIDDAVLVSEHGDTALPIASIAKLVTALVVLDKIPLQPGQSGPTFRMGETDLAFANADAEQGGSNAHMQLGDQLSLRELLDYALIPSSNGHASALATHVFGSEAAYVAAANSWLAANGFKETRIADATGLSPENQASAREIVALAKLAAANPIIARAASRQVLTARDGTVLRASNALLGLRGITGLKTGHTDEAGYTVVFTVPVDANGRSLTGAILGSESETQRATDVANLIDSARAALGKQ